MKKKFKSISSNINITKVMDIIGSKPLTKMSHLYDIYGPIRIDEAAKKSYNELGEKAKIKPGIMVIEVVLSANRNYNKVVRPNILKIENNHPELKTIDDIERLINSKSKEEFYKIWGHRDEKKYKTLSAIIDSIKTLRGVNQDSTPEKDYALLNKWATNFDVKNIRNDIIGKNRNMGVATVQHLRMAFGVDTVKPDQRVKEVLEYEFGLEKPSDIDSIIAVEQIAKECNEKVYVIDQIFVNYGSGYYANAKKKLGPKEIAKNLKDLEVDPEIIAKATKLSKIQIAKL